MEDGLMLCPYCGGCVSDEATICPDCHEDLAGLARIEYEHAIHYNEALSLAREGLYVEAIEALRLALGARPEFVPAHILLAKIRVNQGDWEAAQGVIRRAREIAPQNVDLQSLAERIEETAHSRAVAQLKTQESSALQSRKRAQRRLQVYKRDIASAFVLGMGIASILGAIFGRRGGSRDA